MKENNPFKPILLAEANDYPTEGEVSFYTNDSVDPRWGGVTKSGEKFDETKPTAAVLPEYWKDLKGKTIRVTNPENNKSIEVKINDTGGFGKYGRILDLSKSAFEAIADPKKGTGKFKIEIVEPKPEKRALNLNPFSVSEAEAAEPGNIDLNNRPIIHNPDGSISTEKSFSFNEDGKEVLIPSIVNGKELSKKDAITHYRKTGEHLGKFDSVEEANIAAERIHNRFEGNPFKNIVGEAQQIVSDNPFTDIVKDVNPFSSIITPEDEAARLEVEKNIDIVSRFTGIPKDYLSPKFYEPTGDIKEDATKLGFGLLVGFEIMYEPLERVYHYPIASLTNKLQKLQPFWKSVWESTASMRKFELTLEERTTFFDVMKTYQQDLNKLYNLPEDYEHPLDKPFVVLGGLALRFAMPDIVAGGQKAIQYAGKASLKEAVNTLRLGKDATVQSLDRLSNFIKEAKEYSAFVKEITKTYPQAQAKEIINAARQMRQIINETPIGATKAMPATSVAPQIIPGAPGEASLPAKTVGEILKTPSSGIKDLMNEVKAAERFIPKPTPSAPKTILSWTLRAGRIKTSRLQEHLGKEWKQELPFSVAKNDGRDPSELYTEAVQDGVITPMPADYTGGEAQYFIDQLKLHQNKILEQAAGFEDDLAKEFELFQAQEAQYGDKGIKGDEIKSIEADISKKDIGELIQELDQEGGVVYLDSVEQADSFIIELERNGGTAQISRTREDGVVEVTYYKGEAISFLEKTARQMPTDELEKFIDSRYEAGALQEELNILETVFEERISEEDLAITEEELGVSEATHQGADLEEQLINMYSRYLIPDVKQRDGYIENKDILANMRSAIETYGGKKDITDEQILEAAKDLYENKQRLLTRQRQRGIDVQPTMPPTALRSDVEQTDIPALTNLKYGLSPEVQKTIFDNANDAESKLSEKERAGRILLPGAVKDTLIQDPKLKAALYAGRRKVSYLGSQFIDWIQNAIKSLWEGIKLEYEPTLKDFPQLQDDIRTGPVTFARRAREDADLTLGGLIGNLNSYQEDLFWNILGMRDLIARGGEGITLPRNLKVKDIQPELVRVFNASPQAVKDAVNKYETLMNVVGRDLIAREKLSPDELKSNYFPHYVLDYLPIWWDEASAYLPRRLRQPYRQYTKKAVGTTKDIAINKEAIIWHLTSVFMDNMIDDWAVAQLGKYDKFGLSEEQLKALGPIKPNQVVQVGKQKFKGYQYVPGRQVYPAQMTNPSALNKALEEDLSTQEWLASVGPRGGAPIRQGAVLGRYNRVYLLPIEIYDRFIKLKNGTGVPEFIILANQATQLWKRVTLDFAGIPFQAGNFFGDFINLYRTAPGAATEIGEALNILKDLRHPDTLSQWQQHVLRAAQDKDVLGSGFVQEYAHISPAMSPKGILQRLERLSSLREGVLRLAMLSYQMKRTEVGLPIVAPEFQANIQGLDKVSSAAYVARNFTVDYLALPDWYRQIIRGFAAPFITFYHLNAKNYAKYIKNAPLGFALKFLAPLVGLWAYNNTGERREIEERLPQYWRWRPLRINIKSWDIDGDGKVDRALIWAPQTPVEMAMAMIGMDRIADKVTMIRAGTMTPKEAAIQQLIDSGIAAPQQVHSLLNPMIQFFEGVLSNHDPRTRQEVVPSELKNADNIVKSKYYTRYFIEKMATPFGQYLKDQRGTEHTNLLLSGPLDIMRALGFYEVNLTTAEARVNMDKTRKRRGDYDTYMYRLEQRYLEGRDFTDIIKEAGANGIALRNINERLNSTRVQIEKVKSQLRQTEDKLERRRLEIELDHLIKAREIEYKKTLPKGARK